MSKDKIENYQRLVLDTAIYPMKGSNITYPVLGLCGEAGEVAEKVKKVFRDDDGTVRDEMREAIKKELGDVLWYITAICNELHLTLDEVIDTNREKILGRLERGTLRGSGDDR